MAQDTNPNLQVIGRALISYAATLKTIGRISMGLGPIPILVGIIKYTTSHYTPDTVMSMGLALIGVALLALGLLIWIAGVFLGAMGEALLSLVSIEANISQVNETIQTIAEVRPAAEAVPTHKFCTKCKTRVEITATFCENCGGHKFQA